MNFFKMFRSDIDREREEFRLYFDKINGNNIVKIIRLNKYMVVILKKSELSQISSLFSVTKCGIVPLFTELKITYFFKRHVLASQHYPPII